MTIVEPPFDLFEEQGKNILAESAVDVEPVFGIAPKPFDAVDVGSPLWNYILFGHGDMRPTQPKTGVSPVFDGVLQAADCGVGIDNGQQFGSSSRRDGERSNMPIPLINAEYDGFSFESPAPGFKPEITTCGYFELEFTAKAFSLSQLEQVDARPVKSVETMNRLQFDPGMKVGSIDWNT